MLVGISHQIPTNAELLLFDKFNVLFSDMDSVSERYKHYKDQSSIINTAEYLVDQQIVELSPPERAGTLPLARQLGIESEIDLLWTRTESLRSTIEAKVEDLPGFARKTEQRLIDLNLALEEEWQHNMAIRDCGCRVWSRIIEEREDAEVVSMVPQWTQMKSFWADPDSDPSSLLSMADVAEIAIKGFPIPDENVPLEEILEFRANEDARNQLRALRLWMRHATSTESNRNQIHDELQELIYQYERYMEIQDLKFHRGTIRTLVTATAGFIENMVRLKFKPAVDAFFEFEKERIALQEAELRAPGRQVAYLSTVRFEFRHHSRANG